MVHTFPEVLGGHTTEVGCITPPPAILNIANFVCQLWTCAVTGTEGGTTWVVTHCLPHSARM